VRRILKGFVALLLIATMTACNTATLYTGKELKQISGERKVLLIPVDISLGEVSAGGSIEIKPEWTEKGRKFIEKAVADKLGESDTKLVTVNIDEFMEDEDNIQLQKLHEAVGLSIMYYQLGPEVQTLKTKANTFDWQLGSATQELKKKYGADYALFVFMRDNYASAGRGVVIIAAILLGAPAPISPQIGFASLVDLESGQVVWFNRIINSGGDLRDEEKAKPTLVKLLNEFPK
jgi:hypothetical protein